MKQIKGIFVAIESRTQVKAVITIEGGKIVAIEPNDSVPEVYILPGFIDAHIHIESSMLTPAQFASVAVKHGTVATISDPHEIANVCGIAGIDFMIENGKTVPLKFHFGAPSCVPATQLETAGAEIDANDIEELMKRDDIFYLSEVMNYPAVLNEDKEMMQKLNAAKKYRKPIDGHAPGMRHPDTEQYFSKGISTDHECFTYEEALDKIKCGCKILIREGSAAKNFDALIPLMKDYPRQLMFCSDDKHPDDLLEGHINSLVSKAVAMGYDIYDVLFAACLHPISHYGMNVGQLQIGDPADFILVNDLINFIPIATYIDGECVYENGAINFEVKDTIPINNFHCREKSIEDFIIKSIIPTIETATVHAIEALDGQLITNLLSATLPVENGIIAAQPEIDCLTIAVVNRYADKPVALGFIKNFGIKNAAIASSVAHDSHNIVCVGSNPELMARAVNGIIQAKGGISFVSEQEVDLLPLPIAGIMTNADATTTAEAYQRLTAKAKLYGSKLSAPFMTLSFMALPVIPSLKMTDKGLFDVEKFGYMDLEE